MHLSDEQLNEYLDGESKETAEVELHLASCTHCTARLEPLRALFDELESLPDIAFSGSLARPVMSRVGGRASLPRSIRVVVLLQAALTIAVMALAAPFVAESLPPHMFVLETPSALDLWMQAETQWTAWLDMLAQVQLPDIPQVPPLDFTSLAMISAIVIVSLLWLVGNGLLLRKAVNQSSEENLHV